MGISEEAMEQIIKVRTARLLHHVCCMLQACIIRFTQVVLLGAGPCQPLDAAALTASSMPACKFWDGSTSKSDGINSSGGSSPCAS